MKPTLEQTQFCSQITAANRSQSESNPVMPPIHLQGRPAMSSSKRGERGFSRQCGRYQTLRIWGHTLVSPSGLAGTTLSYLHLAAGRPKVLHPSQLPLLRTSQIQLRDEVKNSCDGVRRGVQSPRTQATAGNQLGTEAQESTPPGQYPGDS